MIITFGVSTWRSGRSSLSASQIRSETAPAIAANSRYGHRWAATRAWPSSVTSRSGVPPSASTPKTADQPEQNNCRLRQHYHFGPAKIAMYLGRYHDVTISVSGVWRILKRLGLNRLPASQRYQRRALRWKRYEKQRPGHQLQVDVKFIEPLGQTGRKQKYYQFTAIDDCTRLRVLRAYPRCDQKTAIAFIDHTLSKLPFAVERVQTDNGSEFGTSFHWHLLDKGIDHAKIKPRTPRLNRKVERSHRIDSEEFYRLLEGQVIDDTRLFTDKLQEREDYYNYHRPHGALGGQTPYERLRQKAQDPLS
jgi:transposase InsO family protein